MALDAGINFRATSGFVTDGANETYCLGDDDSYPTVRDGFTFGYETSVGDDARDRDSGVDRRLAGINFRVNSGSIHTLRLDLDNTVEHGIHLAAGDTASGQIQTVELLDDTTRIALYDSVSTSLNEYMDATGIVRTEADWPGNEAALSHTFTSTILRVKIGDPDDTDSLSTTIAHLRVVEVASGDTNVAANTDALTLSTFAAGVNAETNVEAGTAALTLTEQAASVNAETNVQASTDALTLTEQAASVSLGVDILASVDTLTLTAHAADVQADVNVNAGVAALTMATFAASVSDGLGGGGVVDKKIRSSRVRNIIRGARVP